MISRLRYGLVTGLVLMCGTPAAAQSVFGTDGLGYPMEPQDGRTRALGGVALGLPEPEISWANPAASIGLIAPGLSLSYQYDEFSAASEGAEFKASTARFPMLLAVFPVGQRLVLQGGFGSYLDQSWSVQRPDTLVFGADSIGYMDLISSDGGITRLRVGAAYHVGGGFGIGASADFHTGVVAREEGRIFDPGEGLSSTLATRSWRYRGFGYTLGAHWSPSAVGGVGASLSYGGTLDAEPRQEDGESRTYDLPIGVQVGGTGRLAPNLLVALGGSWTGWSSVDDDLRQSNGARDSWSAQGGAEWDGITIGERGIPIRVGARTGVLPFGGTEDEQVKETAFTTGIGVLLAGGAVRPDVAAEFGTRSAGDLIEEDYWRLSASIRVFGL